MPRFLGHCPLVTGDSIFFLLSFFFYQPVREESCIFTFGVQHPWDVQILFGYIESQVQILQRIILNWGDDNVGRQALVFHR